MDNYEERFGGVGRLLGRVALERLRASHVCVVGVGGVGSWTVEALARCGIGSLTLIDLDDVCVSNFNRQLSALKCTVGRPKVEVLAERVLSINPECRVETVTEFFSEASAQRLLSKPFDFVVDAIDKMSKKVRLIAEARVRGQAVVTVGSAGGRRDPSQIRTGDLAEAGCDEMLRQVRKKLRRDHGFAPGKSRGTIPLGVRCVWSNEPPVFPWKDGTCSPQREPGSEVALDCASGFGTAVFVTGAFGLAAAGEVVRTIAGRNAPD